MPVNFKENLLDLRWDEVEMHLYVGGVLVKEKKTKSLGLADPEILKTK